MCNAAQVFQLSQSVVDEMVFVVMGFRQRSVREVEVESRWRVQAMMK